MSTAIFRLRVLCFRSSAVAALWLTRSLRIHCVRQSYRNGGSVSGDRKLKESTPRLAHGRPQPAPVGIDDRPADRKSHTHAAGFGGEEGGEQPVRILGGDPDAAIRYTYEHLFGLVLAGSDHQFAWPIRDRLHRFNAVHHQVNDHLLQLDPITKD